MKFTTSLKKNHEFRRVYARGKSVATPHVVLYCIRNRTQANRLGITVGTMIGKAVKRNRVRRRLREIYRTNEESFTTGWDLVAVARVRAADATYERIKSDFLRASDKLGILNKGAR